MNKLPRIGDFLYAESDILIARHLRVINVEEKENISDSIITVIGKYGRKYRRGKKVILCRNDKSRKVSFYNLSNHCTY